jgi:hypothetical protein
MMGRLCWGVGPFVRLNNLCYNGFIMDDQSAPVTESPVPPKPEAPAVVEPSPAELRARRLLITGLVIAGLLLVGLVVLLVFLSIDAYQATYAGTGPSPGSVVVGVLRDAAIIFVAFETLIIGVLLIILMLQVQSLIVLLRDEIKPMLEAANETLATVRGTTQFVSHNVVSPVVKWSGYLAGLRRIVREIGGLTDRGEQER